MTVVRIEHPVQSYEAWKSLFDSDPVGRKAMGVQRYRILRSPDDRSYVGIELDFADHDSAARFKAAIEALWQSDAARSALASSPQARILEVAEEGAY